MKSRHPERYLFCEGVKPSRQLDPATASFSGAVDMRAIIVIILSAAALASCTPENDVTGSGGNCAPKLYTPFNPQDMKQCVAACIARESGGGADRSPPCTP